MSDQHHDRPAGAGGDDPPAAGPGDRDPDPAAEPAPAPPEGSGPEPAAEGAASAPADPGADPTPDAAGDDLAAAVDEAMRDVSLDDVDVEALLTERDDLKRLAQQIQADFDNFRKQSVARAQADADRATGRLAEAMRPVRDAAEAAYLRHPEEVGPLLNQMLVELKRQGLETLDLDGQPFDPEVAEAVAHEPADGGEAVVAEVLRSGYRWKGRTLRPAMVKTTD